MKTDYSSRDMYELSEFFEDMLFMRTEKFLPDVTDREIHLSNTGLQLLGNLGITGRIFRRWYQTTWGWDSPSKYFQGETPRMELAGRYQNLTTGDAYVGVQMVQDELSNDVKIVPAMYNKQEIDQAGGIFALGQSFLPTMKDARYKFHLLPAPNYDPGFKEFVTAMEEIEGDIKREKIERLPENIEERMWRVFWSDACISIPLNCELKLSRENLIEMSSVIRIILELAIKEQKNTPAGYIYIDQVVAILWDMFREFDRRLLSMEDLTNQNSKSISSIVNKLNGPYSMNVFYNLNNFLDELLLFPADRYFGAVECVWTDKSNFMDDLAMTISLLNNDLKSPLSPAKLTQEQKKFYQNTNIEEKVTDIYKIWFSPMTCFRILPRFLNYFK